MPSDDTRVRTPRGRARDEADSEATLPTSAGEPSAGDPGGRLSVPASGARTYTEKEVGQIIALATKLQMQAAPQRAEGGPTSAAQVRDIARSLGLDDAHLERALGLLGQGDGCLVYQGAPPDVRQRLAEHFASAVWHSGNVHQPALTPRIVFDGQSGLSIWWSGASLRMRLSQRANESTEVGWETDFPMPELGGFWAKVVFGVLGAAPALAIAATGALAPALVWGLSVGGAYFGGQVLQKHALQRLRERFNAFCRNHLENLQVLLLPRGPNQENSPGPSA